MVRVEGYYRLQFHLFEWTDMTTAYCHSSVLTDAFIVYGRTTFPGMMESTPWTRLCASHGLRVRVRDGQRKGWVKNTAAQGIVVSSGQGR